MKITEKDAFVVIDGQNDFIKEDGALYVGGVGGELSNQEILERIKRFSKRPFGYTVATLDKHPKDNHVEYDIFGKHCVDGTEGQAFHERLGGIYVSADDILIKGMHPAVISYSVITSPDFDEHIANLRKQGIKRVFIAGWAFTHCVGESAIAYAAQGFKVFVIRDCTRSASPPYGDPEGMKKKLELYGVKLINSDEIE